MKTAPTKSNGKPFPGPPVCEYSATHKLLGNRKATGYIYCPALSGLYPRGSVPACDACQKFVNDNA